MKNGFTLIELMIIITIVGIVGAIFMGEMNTKTAPDYVCKAGFKFTNDGKQIIGANGGGVECSSGSVLPTTVGVR